MNTNNSFSQFVKDGLVGVAVALIIFVLLAVRALMIEDFSVANFRENFLIPMFVFEMYSNEILPGPMPFVILTAFIGVGIGGRYLETTTSRKEWEVAILKNSGVSWLAGVGLAMIYGIFGAIFRIITGWGDFSRSLETIGFVVGPFIFGGGVGVFFGLLIGGRAGRIFKLQKRFHRIIIGAISSAFVGYSGGVTWLLLLLFATN